MCLCIMSQRLTRRNVLRATGVGAAVGLAGCASTVQDAIGGGTDVAVGGKQFTEQLLLSNISTLMLEDAGFSVDDAYPVGGNTANHEAITGGDVDHYWEYTGTGWNYHLGNEEEKIRDPEELYDAVNAAYQEEYGLEWLDMADFNNTYVITANPEWQAETGVENLTELAEYLNGGGEVTWAVSQEFIDNPTAFGDLPEFYGFEESMDNVEYEKMAIGTINYQSAAEGQVDLGVGFETNANLEAFDLEIIEDDQNWFVIYYPAPVVNQDILDSDMRDALNAPVDRLDTETMIELNARVSIDEESPGNVAEDWLESEGLI